MQDIHSIGGGGRFYTGTGGGAGAAGGGGGGDRRLRPQQHFHHNHGQQAQPPVLKCPRCDSANTKFCYYNNYNLSQPRHFCKGCRRYWTKGGVLRNVPVGGGCRKTKRSKHKANSSAAAAAAASARERKSSNSHSSSESSSLTATTNAVAGANTTEAVSAPPSNTSDQSKLPPPPPATTANLEGGSSPDCGVLFSELGSFSNLVSNSSSSVAVVGRSGGGGGGGASTMPFEFGSISDVSIGPFRLSNWNQQSHNPEDDDQEMKVSNDGCLMIDPKAQIDLSVLQQDRSNGGGFGSLGDWQQCGDQGLFDLTNTVDQAYWSQNQWNDQDNPSLYLP